jgi:REP-associated tyrosine transposase
MSHTYTQNTIHLVFSTKDRRKLIHKEFKPRLCSYLAGICQKDGIFVHAIDGIEDHVHLLIQIPATLALANAVNTLKSNSSKWANEEGSPLSWQKGYAAFSVSASNIPAVVRYIRNQQSHHKKMTFEAEFLALLKKHNVDFDPKFVFG